MHAQISTRMLHASSDFELGEFRCAPREVSWVRRSVARTHLIALPRTCTEIVQAGQEPVVATPNVAVLYNPGCEYSCRILAPDREITTFLRVSEPALVEAAAEFEPAVRDHPGSSLPAPSCATAASTFLTWVARGRVGGGPGSDTLEIEERLHAGLRCVLRDAYSGRVRIRAREPSRTERLYARWVEEFMARHFRERTDLRVLGEKIGLSPAYLCRVFRATTGTSIHAYRDGLRLRTAAQELSDPERRLSQVAMGLGYCAQSHFTCAFRRYFGVSPGRFRRAGRRAGADVG